MNINEIFKQSGLTVSQFAESVYVSRRTMHYWLSGRPIPRLKQRIINKVYPSKSKVTNQGDESLD
jgi:DNA-binding transcriptional regulator YiaG